MASLPVSKKFNKPLVKLNSKCSKELKTAVFMKNDTSCLLKSFSYDTPCKLCNGKLNHRKLTKIYCTFKEKLLGKFANKIGPQRICPVVTIASLIDLNVSR